jgi:hypothetical protein
MARRLSSRTLLRGTATVLGTSVAGVASLSRRGSAADRFDPDTHGFGFRNWSSRDQYFEAPPAPSPAAVRERVASDWSDQSGTLFGAETTGLPEPTIAAVAAALRTAVVQRAGTNGHCYGMVLAAQRYFEDPERIPVDRPTASDIELPTVPVGEPSAPVYEEILQLQAAQFLRFRAWLGRRAMLYPDRIDVGQVLRDLRSVVGTFGTAAITLFDESLYGHQVLVYDVADDGDGTTLAVYDPNRPATAYRGSTATVRFERDGDGVSMVPYQQYTHALFNRYDRIERAANRERATPLDHVTADRSTLRESLFPFVLVRVDSPDVSLAVVGPDGAELDRLRGRYADRSRGEYARVRSRYGAAPGRYCVCVFGDRTAAYEMAVDAVDADGAVLREKRTATVEAAERHDYDVEIPERGAGTLRRSKRDRLRAALTGGAGVVGGVAVGAAGYRAVKRRRGRDGSD